MSVGTSAIGEDLVHKYGTNDLKILTFSVGEYDMIINISKVIKVISFNENPISPVSVFESEHYVGMINHHGKFIPVINLFTYFDDDTPKNIEDQLGIVAEFDGEKMVFIVSSVDQNITIKWEDVVPTEHLLTKLSVVNGQVLMDDKIYLFVDFECIRDHVSGISYHLGELQDVEPDSVNILFAEDSQLVRKVVTDELKARNFDVTACENGKIAWDKFQATPEAFDLVISDIEMPLKDGTSLIADIRSHPNGKTVPIIIMSSMTISENVEQYLHTGANAFVSKNKMGDLQKSINELVLK